MKISVELETAFARLGSDQRRYVFFRHPCKFDVVSENREKWLSGVQTLLDNNSYVPQPAPPISTAKPEWHVRPGVLLELEDQLIYHYLGLQMVSVVGSQIKWSEGERRFSHFLEESGDTWFSGGFTGWKRFDSVSLAKLRKEAKYVYVTDLAGFYENIDIGRLVKDLDANGVPGSVCKTLSACLNKWAGPRGRGIPQGYSPSDFLAEFYLNNVDRALSSEGFEHLRYNDDFRIFARSRLEAIRAFHRLSELVRERGLNLQSAKTEILSSEEGIERFSLVTRLLQQVSTKIGRALKKQGVDDHYFGPDEIRKQLRSDPEDPAPAVVEEAWKAFTEGEFGRFNKTLFHFLIARLAELKSDEGIDYCLSILEERPEETLFCLNYLKRRLDALTAPMKGRLVNILVRRETIFEHQRYQLLRWFYENEVEDSNVRAFCRANLRPRQFTMVPSYASVYLGSFAEDNHDYERLESTFNRVTSTTDRATFLYALRDAPTALRNSVYGRARGEAPLIDWVIRIVKGKSS